MQPLGQFLCAGANYRKHLIEIVYTMARNDPQETRPDEVLRQEAADFVHHRAESGMPFVFWRRRARCRARGDDIVLWGPGAQHDWEIELAIVIGRHARPRVARGRDGVRRGYTISNDVSTRDLMSARASR